jgi:hypothetical protein
MPVAADAAALFWPMGEAMTIVRVNPAATPLLHGRRALARSTQCNPAGERDIPSFRTAAMDVPQTICLTIRGLLSGRCEREEASKLRPCMLKEIAR